MQSLFNEAKVTHKDFYGSDDQVLILEFCPSVPSSIEFSHGKPFRFEPFWQSQSNFVQVLEEIWAEGSHEDWSSPNGLFQKLKDCGKRLKAWSYKSFGNIHN